MIYGVTPTRLHDRLIYRFPLLASGHPAGLLFALCHLNRNSHVFVVVSLIVVATVTRNPHRWFNNPLSGTHCRSSGPPRLCIYKRSEVLLRLPDPLVPWPSRPSFVASRSSGAPGIPNSARLRDVLETSQCELSRSKTAITYHVFLQVVRHAHRELCSIPRQAGRVARIRSPKGYARPIMRRGPDRLRGGDVVHHGQTSVAKHPPTSSWKGQCNVAATDWVWGYILQD